MWMKKNDPFIKGLRFNLRGKDNTDKWTDWILKENKTSTSFELGDESEYYNKVRVWFANDADYAKNEPDLTGITLTSNKGNKASVRSGIYKGWTSKKIKYEQISMKDGGAGRKQIVGVRGVIEGGVMRMMAGGSGLVQMQFCWAPDKSVDYCFICDGEDQQEDDDESDDEKETEEDDVEKDIAAMMEEAANLEQELKAKSKTVQQSVEMVKTAVKGIRGKHFNDFKKMRKQKALVIKTVKAVCLLLGKQSNNWKWSDCQRLLEDGTFISGLLSFDSKVEEEVLNEVAQMFDKKWNHENVNKESKVAGVMFKWMEAKIKWTRIQHEMASFDHKVRGLKNAQMRNALLTDWGLMAFADVMTESGFDDPSEWHTISMRKLQSAPINMDSTQSQRFKEGLGRYQLLDKWELTQFAGKMLQSGYGDISQWQHIEDKELTEKLGMKSEEVTKWKNGVQSYRERVQREEEVRVLLSGWKLQKIADKMIESGNDHHSEWINLSGKLERELKLNPNQIILWNEGMKKYKLLNDWGLSEFMVKLERSKHGDFSKWHQLLDDELKAESIGMNDEQIIKWKEGLHRYQLLSKWGLSEFADKMMQSGYGDISKWHEISDGDLVKKLQMKPGQIKKWKSGVTQHRQQQLREQQVRTLLNLWGLSQFADKMIQSDHSNPAEWPKLSDNKLTKDIQMKSEHLLSWKDGMRKYMLLSGWGLADFTEKMEESKHNDIDHWHEITDEELKEKPIEMNADQIKQWKEGMNKYLSEMQRKKEMRILLTDWGLDEFIDQMNDSGYNDHSKWHTISENNLGMKREQIILWRRGLRRYKLLSDWNLSEFVTKMETSHFGALSVWHQISEEQLKGEPLQMDEDQIRKWKDGVQRYQQRMEQMKTLMNDWGLGKFSENVINNTCKDIDSWHKIPGTELKQKDIGMKDGDIKKWNDGLKQYMEQQEREKKVRSILSEWSLAEVADSMIRSGNTDPSLWHEITEEELKGETLAMNQDQISKWNDGLKRYREEKRRKKEEADQKQREEEEEQMKKEAEQALNSATKAVKNMNKSQLNTLRKMNSPHIAIQKTVFAVRLLLGENVKRRNWKEDRKILEESGGGFFGGPKTTFFDRFSKFTVKGVNNKTLRALDNMFQSDPNWTADRIKSSQAALIMFKWVKAVVDYSHSRK